MLSLVALSLAGCTPTYEQYANYKISDNDMKQVIAQYKTIFYGIHPEAFGKSADDTYNIVYRKISDAENAVWGNIQYQTFTNIIGQRDTDKMWKDHHSSQYRN